MSESRKYTEAQKKSAKKWDAANLDRMSLALPKGTKEAIRVHAEGRGESSNSFIKRAIMETMERDNAAEPPRTAQAKGNPLPAEDLQAAQSAAQDVGESSPLQT